MKIEFHPNLVEPAVFLSARTDGRRQRQWRRATDHLYDSPAGPEREKVFQQAHARLFERFELGAPLLALLDERPAIGRGVAVCRVQPAPGRRRESVELMVKAEMDASDPAACALLIKIRPESLIQIEIVRDPMRRDLMQIHDMLDPRFGYRRETLEGQPARQNLIRDRYHVLWEISVMGRLTREGKTGDPEMLRLRADVDRIFAHAEPEAREALFSRFQTDGLLTYDELMDVAQGHGGLGDPSGGEPETSAAQPGAPCPLCAFPTFDWFDFGPDPKGPLVSEIAASHPGWRPDRGACRQCAELYAASLPAIAHAAP